MKLAEALLQDRPIRCVGSKSWVTPIIHQDKTGRLYLKYMNENTCYYLNNYNFNLHDWEVKPEPIKFEFEMSADHSVVNKIDECIPSLRGKRIKVTCEEIEG